MEGKIGKNIQKRESLSVSSETNVRSCSNCGFSSLSRKRSFSEKAWKVLLLWNEINPTAVYQSICDTCYDEMRNILIDRADEIDSSLKESPDVHLIKSKVNHVS